jgi:uncharacterized HAD superfamily protein
MKRQEFETIPDSEIVICDIDGTLGDWRSSFVSWMESKGITKMNFDTASSMMLDNDLALNYPEYYKLKEDYESSGGYRTIKPYQDTVEVLRKLKKRGAYIIIVTARPQERFGRIWLDTWLWLKTNKIPVDKLSIISGPRVLLATSLRKVIMLEDDPGLILRGANSGIKIFARKHLYNSGIFHPNAVFVDEYSFEPIEEFLYGDQNV